MAKAKDLIDRLDEEQKSEENKFLKVEHNPNQQALQKTMSELEYLNWLIPHLEQQKWKMVWWKKKDIYYAHFNTVNYRLEKLITQNNGSNLEIYLLDEYIEDESWDPYTGDMIRELFEKIEKK